MTDPRPRPAIPQENKFALPAGGYVAVALPRALSKDEYEVLRGWLQLVDREAQRRTVDHGAGVTETEPGDGRGPAGPADDDDSLSWE